MDAASQTQPPVQPSPLLLSPHNEAERSTPIPFSDPAPSFSEPRPEPSTTPNNRSSDPNSAPVSFDMNHSGPWTTPWNWGGSLGSNNSQNTNHGQDHDRDSPMPDAQPEPEIPSLDEEPPPPAPPARNIVRVTSNGTSIDSADPPDLRNDPPAEPTDEDMTDNQMPDAPTDEQLLNETGGDPNTHRPPEPPDPELTQHPPVSNYETPWYQIPEDRSYAEEDELKRLESAGEVSALDHEHWMQKTFKDLQDPEHYPVDSGHIQWFIPRFNGTKESPNKDLVMRSESVKIGGYMWRIKLYPKGNGTSYLGAYVECVDFLCPTAGENDTTTKTSEEVPVPMPVLNGTATIEKQHRVPVQLSIMIYNPKEPRVHFHKRASHGFTSKDPDRGFSRFGPCPFFDLGRRIPETRQAILRDDQIGFIAHIRVLKDPTGFLFTHEDTNCREDFCKTGLRPLKTSEDRRGPANNLSAAVTSWALLAPFRRIIYSASQIKDGKPRPLISAFEELLCDLRRPIDANTQASNPQGFLQVSLDRIAEAIQWWGMGRGHETCRDWVRHKSTIQKRDEEAFQHANKDTRLAWHPFNEPLHDCDVIQVFEILLDHLESELGDTNIAGAFLNLFTQEGFRCKLPMQSTSIRSGLISRLAAPPAIQDTSFPPILQVEVPRQKFNQDSHKWEKLDDRVTISELVKMTPEQQGMYALYGFVTHDWGLNSRAFSPILRPDGRNWYKFSTDRFAKAEKITTKQALGNNNENRVYIAIYVRSDFMETEVDPSSPNFVGYPEDKYQVPEDLLHKYDPPAKRQAKSEKTSPAPPASEGRSTSPGRQTPTNQTQSPDHSQSSPQPSLQTSSSDEIEVKIDSSSEEAERENDGVKNADSSTQKSPSKANHPLQEDDIEWDQYQHSSQIFTIDYFSRGFYQGHIHKGHMHGQGHSIYMNGDSYKGQFRKGLRHGSGMQTFQNGDVYEGEWLEDKMHGHGKLVNALTGNTYVGGFREGNQFGEFILSGKKAEALKLCLVCYTQERNAVFYPCGHVCACLDCAREIEDCPYCHKHIAEPIRFYFT